MALSQEDIAALTLGDLQAIACKFEHAVGQIRSAQAFLSGLQMPGSPTAIPGQYPVGNSLVVTIPQPHVSALTPAEQREKERLLKTIRGEDLPDNIRAAEEA